MHDAPVDLLERKKSLWVIPLALIMGIALGLFVNGYWLAGLFPPSSKQLLLLTAVITIAGAAVYWLIIPWGAARLRSMPERTLLAGALASLAAGALLFFAGTSQWMMPARYVSFLLPIHRLQIRASVTQPAGGLALTWFTTSVGDVSYATLNSKGWTRSGDRLVLEQPAGNSIEWQGRTGGNVQLFFESEAAGQTVAVTWDGREQELKTASGRFTYSHDLDVPWYASEEFVYLLGIVVLASLAWLAYLLLWEHRAALAEDVRASVAGEASWDRRETLFLLGAALIGLLLRLPALGRAQPAVDEYFHLIAARQLAEGAALSSVYGRSLWMVTLPVSLAFRAFGYQLWAARLGGVIINVLGIWPLYRLARKINRPIAILSVVLYLTSPWIITFARIAREYAYYPVFAYWIVLGMVSFIGRVPRGLVLLRDWSRMLTRDIVLIGLALLLPPVYAFVVDPLSTFRVLMIAYVVFAGFMLARLDWRHPSNLPVLAALAVGAAAACYAAYLRDAAMLVPVPKFNPVPVGYFFPNPPQQWYFGRLVILAVVAMIAAAVCSFVVRRVTLIPAFLLCLYVAYLAFFTFLSKDFFHTRHLSTTELWYIILLATGLYFGWRVLKRLRPWSGWAPSTAVVAILALALTNAGQILLPITSTKSDNVISEDYLHDMSAVQAYLLGHAQPQDALVSTVYGLYNSWIEAPRFKANYRITIETPLEQVLSLIDQHESGWIVIDQIRLDMSSFGPHAFAGNADVEYIGLFGDQNVWHWQHAPGAVGNIKVAEKAP